MSKEKIFISISIILVFYFILIRKYRQRHRRLHHLSYHHFPTLSHLSRSNLLVPLYPTHPTLPHTSHSTPLIPLYPIYPTLFPVIDRKYTNQRGGND